MLSITNFWTLKKHTGFDSNKSNVWPLFYFQGCFAEIQSDKEQQGMTRENVMLMYELGVFCTFVELLNIENE